MSSTGSSRMRDDSIQKLQAGRIDPMHVLEDHQNGIPPGERLQLADESLQCPRFSLLRAEIQCREASGTGQGEQI
jgi:hypothetical protein